MRAEFDRIESNAENPLFITNEWFTGQGKIKKWTEVNFNYNIADKFDRSGKILTDECVHFDMNPCSIDIPYNFNAMFVIRLCLVLFVGTI